MLSCHLLQLSQVIVHAAQRKSFDIVAFDKLDYYYFYYYYFGQCVLEPPFVSVYGQRAIFILALLESTYWTSY